MGYTRRISRYDNGCSHHPDCFSCPFTDCLYNRPPRVIETVLGTVDSRKPWTLSNEDGTLHARFEK